VSKEIFTTMKFPADDRDDSVASSTGSTSSGEASAQQSRNFIFKTWTSLTDLVHRGISQFVLTLSLVAARNPKRSIGFVTALSFALIAAGFFTNFNIQVDYKTVYAPFGSLPLTHDAWIDNEAGFPEETRPFSFVLHNNGNNVLGLDQVDSLFEVLDKVRGTPGYDEICQSSSYMNPDGKPDCKIFGATRFWDHSAEKFRQEIHTDEEAIRAMSAATYPGGTPVYSEYMLGYPERQGGVDTGGNHNGTLLVSAKSYFLRINFPSIEGLPEFEIEVLDRLMALREEWESNLDGKLQLTYFTLLAYDLEFERAIQQDMMLVPCVFIIMSAFTCLVFYKSDRVQSRMLLGLCSVAAVALSLMSGYGLMFLIGVPFTSMSQMLPFIVFGVG
jgi:Patched family